MLGPRSDFQLSGWFIKSDFSRESQNSGTRNSGDSRAAIYGVTQHEMWLRLGLMGFKCIFLKLEVFQGKWGWQSGRQADMPEIVTVLKKLLAAHYIQTFYNPARSDGSQAVH